MFWKLKTPLRDYLSTLRPEIAAHWIDSHPKSQVNLGSSIAVLIMDAASSLANPGKALRCDLKIAPDVLAFEAIAFAYHCIRYAYEPHPDNDDDEQEFAEANFDEFMNDAFIIAQITIIQVVEMNGGWKTEEIFRRRLLKYLQQPGVREATEEFIHTLESTAGAKAPMLSYPGPLSLDLKQHLALIGCVMPFVVAIPPNCAESLRRIMQGYNWSEPGLNGARFGDRVSEDESED